jgi:hypothetical protein
MKGRREREAERAKEVRLQDDGDTLREIESKGKVFN